MSRAGLMGFQVANARSRIANLGSLAVHPRFRGRRLADEAARLFQRHLLFDLGYHRLQLEIYGFNERAQAHAERAGFVREGVRRKAYDRHGEWVDGVIYGLVREDLRAEPDSAAVDLVDRRAGTPELRQFPRRVDRPVGTGDRDRYSVAAAIVRRLGRPDLVARLVRGRRTRRNPPLRARRPSRECCPGRS